MIAIALCVLAFIATYIAGKRSLGKGLIALFVFGYFYGILRANLLTTFSHFIFDAGLIGLFLSQKWKAPKQSRMIQAWVVVLVGWCCLMVLMPFQPLLISLVGLRGNAFFIPLLLLGSLLKDKDLKELGYGIAALNLCAILFAWAEYFQGVPRYFPPSPVTQIIYMSGDVAGGYFRIPAIFSSAHAYGGTMVITLPYLIGAWERASNRWSRLLLLAGIGSAMLGILMSATRLNFILGSVLIMASLVMRKQKASSLMIFGLLLGVIVWTAMTNSRFQRFKTLGDTDLVSERIAGSVNRGFFEILMEYPMGNGLGGGGTSMPYFLQGQVHNPIGLENEYARILCEQGIIGLSLWIGFELWFFGRAPTAFRKNSWSVSRRAVWCLVAFCLSTAWIGIGFFTSIPQSVLYLLAMGWVSTDPVAEPALAGATLRTRAVVGRRSALATTRP